jgi:flagellar biosynthesis protein FlhG
MNDQANLLRQLVRQEAALRSEATGAARLMVVAAGKGGVGATTVAVNLGIALLRGGAACVLVDGNPHSAGATTLCGLDAQFGVSHVVAGWRTAEETLLVGPGGIQVLPGVWDREYDDQWTERAQLRLIEELRTLELGKGNSSQRWVIADAGCGLGATLGRFWRAADLILAVTTPDPLAIMDTYAAIKVHADGSPAPVHVLVNQAADTQQATDVQQRLARACHRFLGLAVHDAGYVPIVPRSAERETSGDLFVLDAPESTAARCVNRVAEAMIGLGRPSGVAPCLYETSSA